MQESLKPAATQVNHFGALPPQSSGPACTNPSSAAAHLFLSVPCDERAFVPIYFCSSGGFTRSLSFLFGDHSSSISRSSYRGQFGLFSVKGLGNRFPLSHSILAPPLFGSSPRMWAVGIPLAPTLFLGSGTAAFLLNSSTFRTRHTLPMPLTGQPPPRSVLVDRTV